MMKKIIACLLTGLSLTVAQGASAAPVTLSGDVSLKYAKETAAGSADASGTMSTFKLLGKTELGNGWSAYARLGGQYATQPLLGDFNTAAYGKKTAVAIDQYGLGYQKDNMAYKLGRQDVTIGATTLLYSRPDSNIGKKQFVDGVTANGTIGATELAVVAAREDNAAGEFKNKVYAARGGYALTDSISLGLTLGRYQGELDNTNHWAVDATYKLGKSSFTAEHTQSSSSYDNKAHALVLQYAFDDKLSASVTGFRVEALGSMGGQSDFDADNRGVHYGLQYKLDAATNIDVVYKKQKTISGGEKNTAFEATLSYAF